MRLIIKRCMSQTSYSVIESVFPDDIITSGDYESAENLLNKKSIPSEILAESFYRLGNRFYSSVFINFGVGPSIKILLETREMFAFP